MDRFYDLKIKFIQKKPCNRCRKQLPHLFKKLVNCYPPYEREVGIQHFN